jgi:hypothetical protein
MYKIGNFSFNTIFIKDHAALRMLYRDISKADLATLITHGEIIEDYPNDFPFPGKLVFKMVNNRPLHVVIALNAEKSEGIVVTLYEADSLHFEPDFKTRKK